ncbi:MAG: Methionine aminopeptidase 1 [Lentisphaerae bacterium ADurb.Bin082]|nr:MAG: Methionine aminopeptidase 1 [Lentisphaerae bacterium ADurb.Bin082]
MVNGKIHLYSQAEVEGVRIAAQASAAVLARLCEAVTPGMSTADLDMLAESFIRETGGKSAFLGYRGYPGHICVSLNDEVVHGIGRPDRIIAGGDLVSLDVGVTIGGYVGDNARTVCAGGQPGELAAHLMQTTADALQAGIDKARPGNCLNDIGATVERIVKAARFEVVRDMVGHGCGIQMHEPPEVPNYRVPGKSPALLPGMILAIEPMVNAGTWRITVDRKDGWTVRTADGSLSAHFEHQILITENDPEILTWPKTV